MIAEVATKLLGEIVEIYEWSDNYSDSGTRDAYRIRGRGCVRAVYVADKSLMVLVEHNLGCTDRTKDGGFEVYSLCEGRARVVQHCDRCGAWDQKLQVGRTGGVHRKLTPPKRREPHLGAPARSIADAARCPKRGAGRATRASAVTLQGPPRRNV